MQRANYDVFVHAPAVSMLTESHLLRLYVIIMYWSGREKGKDMRIFCLQVIPNLLNSNDHMVVYTVCSSVYIRACGGLPRFFVFILYL